MGQVLEFKKREKTGAAHPEMTRWLALDVLRGLCVMGMILVAYAGDWAHRFGVLNHADWHGLALADMIFPGFLFCVGLALPTSLARRSAGSTGAMAGHTVVRAALLIALGLFLNLLPGFDFGHVRIMGILQRIGLAYAAVGLFCIGFGVRKGEDFSIPFWPPVLAAASLCLGYGAILRFVPMPDCGAGCFDSSHSLPTVIDRAVFGVHHLWPWGQTDGIVTYDPEGLLSTLGAIVNVLIGVIVAQLIAVKGLRAAIMPMGLLALILMVTGAGLDNNVPIIKKIWTPSFSLFSGGFSLLLFCALTLVLDLMKWTAWAWPAKVFGANATAAFVGISLLDIVAQSPLVMRSDNTAMSLHEVAAVWLGTLIPDARVASVTYSVILVMILLVVLWPMYSRRIFLKL